MPDCFTLSFSQLNTIMKKIEINGERYSTAELARLAISDVTSEALTEQDYSRIESCFQSLLDGENEDAAWDALLDISPTVAGIVDLVEEGLSVTDDPQGAIIRAASHAMLTGMEDHFTFDENGFIQIVVENTPTIPQTQEMLCRILSVNEATAKIDNFSTWNLGALLDQAINLYGDDFDMSEMIETTEKAYNTMITALGVYRQFGNNKRESLSFSHHKEVMYAKITDDEKELALDIAEKMKLPTAIIRKVCSYIRHNGSAALVDREFETIDDLQSIINIKSANKHWFFIINGRIYRHNGDAQDIPANASMIIDANSNQEYRAGERREIPVWERPYTGTEAPQARTTPQTVIVDESEDLDGEDL